MNIENEVSVLPHPIVGLVYAYARPDTTSFFAEHHDSPIITGKHLRQRDVICRFTGDSGDSVEELLAFCEEHHLTSDDFDRPLYKHRESLWDLACRNAHPRLIRHMCEQRLKRLSSFIYCASWVKESSRPTGDEDEPRAYLLYSMGDFNSTPLVRVLASEAKWSKIDAAARYILSEAADLINVSISRSHSPLFVLMEQIGLGEFPLPRGEPDADVLQIMTALLTLLLTLGATLNDYDKMIIKSRSDDFLESFLLSAKLLCLEHDAPIVLTQRILSWNEQDYVG